MDYLKKLLLVLVAINDTEKLTPKGRTLYLHPNIDQLRNIPKLELRNIFDKLSCDEKIISISHWPYRTASSFDRPDDTDLCYGLKKRKPFNDYFSKISAEFRAKSAPVPETAKTIAENSKPIPQHCLWVSYTAESGQVLVNDVFTLGKTNYNSENELVFSYLVKNPNKIVTARELMNNATREPLKKRLHEIVRDLGFKGDLAKAFFRTASEDIYFRNPVSKADLSNLGISAIKMAAISEKTVRSSEEV